MPLTADISQNQLVLKQLLDAGKAEEARNMILRGLMDAKNNDDEDFQDAIKSAIGNLAKTTDWNALKQCMQLHYLILENAEDISHLKFHFNNKIYALEQTVRKAVFALEDFSQVINVFESPGVAAIIAAIPESKKIGTSAHTIAGYEGLLKKINISTLDNKEKFIENIILASLKSKNLLLLQALFTQNPEIYNRVKHEVQADQKYSHSNKFMFEMIDKINLSDIYKSNPNLAVNSMHEFAANIGSNLSTKSALMYLAAKYENANSNMVSMPDTQKNDFFEFLSNATVPSKTEFILTGWHWISGQANIDQNGKLQLIIIDPLGWSENNSLSPICESIIGAASKHFANAEFHVAKEKKQNAKNICSFISLDDAVHLRTVDRYLDKATYPGGLYDYLKTNTSQVVSYENHEVNIANMPLYLLRTAQTTSLLDLMGQNRKGENVLNKQNVTPAQYAKDKTSFTLDTKSDRLQNQRLNEKVDRMIQKCFELVIRSTPEQLDSMMAQYTLAGLKAKLPLRTETPEPSKDPTPTPTNKSGVGLK